MCEPVFYSISSIITLLQHLGINLVRKRGLVSRVFVSGRELDLAWLKQGLCTAGRNFAQAYSFM